ncbi:MAG TPA: PHP domain-containing protein, partial [Acidimicrobiales bacterium]
MSTGVVDDGARVEEVHVAGGAGRDSFAHLHVHTEFSMLDGAARVKDLVAAAAADGQPALA